MHIGIEWRDGPYPSFKLILSKAEGADPFLEIKNIQIKEGRNGAFLSYPAQKGKDDKWYPHVYGGKAFNEHVLKLAQAALPKSSRPKQGGSGFDDMADDPPF